MISLEDKAMCCGCGACENICPHNSIEMVGDDEGFLYPRITGNCTECGLCTKVCPIISKSEEKEKLQLGYIVQNKSVRIRNESTSGGAFSAIAEYTLERGGVVFGAAFDKKMELYHTFIEDKNEIEKFRGSKYLQSRIGRSYEAAKTFLKTDRLVCFSGTPCQIEGLKKFLGKEYINLITVDLVCRAVASPKIFQKYVAYINDKYKGTPDKIKFRDKQHYGYQYSQIAFYDKKNQCYYHGGLACDYYLRAFFSNICNRPSCYSCSFKKRYRESDFTIWDCFDAGSLSKGFDNKGTTRMLLHTGKANAVFDGIKDKLNYKKINSDVIVNGVVELTVSVDENSKRDEFFTDAVALNGEGLFRKYFPVKFKNRIENVIRIAGVKTGMSRVIKKIGKQVLKNYKRN